MKNNNLNINDLSSEYLEIANFTKESLQETFADFGIDLHNFNIQGIDLDESDSGYIEVMKAISDRAKSQIMGDQNYWQKKDQMEIGMMAASNEGMAGGMMGAGLGLGIGQMMGNMMGNAPQAQNTGYSQTAPPPPPQTLSFYMAQNGQTTGPFTIEQIQQGIMSNAVTKQTYFCLVGGQQWLFAEQIPQINALFATAPPPPPPAPSM